jgi:NADH-quinone oxidoreductase subunit L
LILGFVNAPFLGSQLHEFAGEVHEASEVIHSEVVAFNYAVAALSTVLAVGGLLGGWAIYRNYRAGEVEPFQRWLGPVFTVLKNKYYVDELYQLIIIRPVVWLADQVFSFDNKWVIDPFVNLVGRVGRVASDISRVFDEVAIDSGMVEGTANAVNSFGGWLRQTQTGRVQNYVLVIGVTVLLLLGLYLYL